MHSGPRQNLFSSFQGLKWNNYVVSLIKNISNENISYNVLLVQWQYGNANQVKYFYQLFQLEAIPLT